MRGPWEFEDPACREIGTEIFYLNQGETELAKEAKAICGRCIHRKECADWGIHNEKFGVWGGLTEDNRRLLRRKLKIIIKETHDA